LVELMAADDTSANVDAKTAALIRRLLAEVPGLWAREQAVVRANSHAVGSSAEVDNRQSLGRFAWELAGQALGVAGDHLETWRRLIEDARAQPGWAHVTILRGAMETACLCRYLVDPKVSSPERLRRGVAAQLADWDERRKFEETTGVDKKPRTGKARSAAQRIEKLSDDRDASCVGVIRHPSLTDLCRDFAVSSLGGLAAYRLASGFAHGKQWTLLVSDASAPEGVDPDQPGPRRVAASDNVTAVITACAVRTFATAVSEFEIYTTAVAVSGR
jgi:hypothetical protein